MSIENLVDKAPQEHIIRASYLCEHAAVLLMDETVDLIEFGGQMGLEPVPHNRRGDIVWDVKPMTAAGSNRQTVRSQTAEAFPLHTDASFEEIPPRYFMLQVLHGDRFGGGQQSFVPVDSVLGGIHSAILGALAKEKFRWRVPLEFQKNVTENELPILFSDDQQAPAIRYREECIIPRRSKRETLLLSNLKAALRYARSIKHQPSQNEVLLVDNWRILHSRGEVRDPIRHLQRVRFR